MMDNHVVRLLLVGELEAAGQPLQDALVSTSTTPAGRATHFQISSAGRLDEAQSLLAQEAFDIILLFISSGQSDAPAAVRQLRQLAAGPPIILIDSDDNEATARQALQAGAQNYFPLRRIDPYCLRQAIHNLLNHGRMEQELKQQRELADALREAAAATASSLDLNQVLEAVLVHLERVIPYSSATLFLQRGEFVVAVAGRGLPAGANVINQQFPLTEDSLETEIARTQNYLILEDAQQDPRFFKWGNTGYVRGWMGIPLRVRGKIMGQLTVDSRQRAAFSEAQAQIAQAFADQVAVAIDNALLHQETKRAAEELKIASDILRLLNATPNIRSVFASIISPIKALTGCSRVSLALLDETTEWSTIYALDRSRSEFDQGAVLRVKDSVAADTLIARQTHITPDLATETDWPVEKTLYEAGYRSRILLPLISGDALIGSLHLTWRRVEEYNLAYLPLLQQIANAVALAVERSRLYERLDSYAADLEQRVERRTRALAEANERLMELDQLKSKFVADMSHELRTPINNFSLYLHLLESSNDPERSRRYMTVLKNQTARLAQLVEDVLNLSRLEHSNDDVMTAVQLNTIINEVCSAQKERARAKEIQLLFKPNVDLAQVWGNESQLIQVVSNLIVNAVNYTETGSVLICTFMTNDDTQVCLEIEDTGIGIHPTEIPHIFERFYRGHAVSQSSTPGTGLGLAIVKEIIDLHNGEIDVHSQLGLGATFTIRLPAMRKGQS